MISITSTSRNKIPQKGRKKSFGKIKTNQQIGIWGNKEEVPRPSVSQVKALWCFAPVSCCGREVGFPLDQLQLQARVGWTLAVTSGASVRRRVCYRRVCRKLFLLIPSFLSGVNLAIWECFLFLTMFWVGGRFCFADLRWCQRESPPVRTQGAAESAAVKYVRDLGGGFVLAPLHLVSSVRQTLTGEESRSSRAGEVTECSREATPGSGREREPTDLERRSW